MQCIAAANVAAACTAASIAIDLLYARCVSGQALTSLLTVDCVQRSALHFLPLDVSVDACMPWLKANLKMNYLIAHVSPVKYTTTGATRERSERVAKKNYSGTNFTAFVLKVGHCVTVEHKHASIADISALCRLSEAKPAKFFFMRN